ncbi:MAG: prepilin-type N-terminal cleavage/methylation domain-containing protein [Proteobacteria bacterium]|nr:prepilin-type N-terminal cleavage/methylation domain-containing protein [Pseudomonadota bacterium]MBU1715171.1 prepilin-type N-terminal cleavage/methylation domain-containing protein [Pseudomonadota bacterium]
MSPIDDKAQPGFSRCAQLRDGKGFTLMEILVAMMIVAISITVILQLFSGGLRSGELSKNYLRAVFYAREKMEEILLADLVVGETQAGELADGYRWSAVVEPNRADDVDNSRAKLMLYSVSVDVNWQEGRHRKHFTLSTLRLGPVIDADNPS